MNSSTEMSLSEQAEGAVDDPAVQLLHHPGALRRLDEAARGQQLALLAGHPQQQLVALDLARAEVLDRLAVQAEPVLGERVADPRRGRLPALRLALRLARVAEEGDLVAAALLRPVHRLVGGDEHRFGADPLLAAEHRHADADRRRRRVRGRLDACLLYT